MDIHGRLALVTGASSGIGETVANAIARQSGSCFGGTDFSRE
jgi:NADP-dependent 3-hydroxy acid dehydrogenase YdfG